MTGDKAFTECCFLFEKLYFSSKDERGFSGVIDSTIVCNYIAYGT